MIRATASRRAAVIAWGLAGLIVLPYAVLAFGAFAQQWRYPALLPAGWSLRAWTALAGGGALLDAAGRSALIALAVSLLSVTAALITSQALAIARHRERLQALALLPFFVSPVVIGMSLQQLLLRSGLDHGALGVLLAQSFIAYAYAVLLMNALWSPTLLAMGDAAAGLGASKLAIWREVWLPVGAGVIAMALFQTFSLSWFDYALARVIGGGRVVTLPIRVFEALSAGDLRVASAGSLLLVLPPAVAFLLARRLVAASPLLKVSQ